MCFIFASIFKGRAAYPNIRKPFIAPEKAFTFRRTDHQKEIEYTEQKSKHFAFLKVSYHHYIDPILLALPNSRPSKNLFYGSAQ